LSFVEQQQVVFTIDEIISFMNSAPYSEMIKKLESLRHEITTAV